MPTQTYEKNRRKLGKFLGGVNLIKGRGYTFDRICSMQAVNWVLEGTMDDGTPECVCPVVGAFVRLAQDNMPDDLRNGEWKAILPNILGSNDGRGNERESYLDSLAWKILPQLFPNNSQWAEVCNGQDRVEMMRFTTVPTQNILASHKLRMVSTVPKLLNYLELWNEYPPHKILAKLLM